MFMHQTMSRNFTMMHSMHTNPHSEKRIKLSDGGSSASYIPFGSFQAPEQQSPRNLANPQAYMYVQGNYSSDESTMELPMNPPAREASGCMKEQMRPQKTLKPLHACPGLPKPNQEMKYYSWNNANRHNSGVNLSKMTHFDHSEAQKKTSASYAQGGEGKKKSVDDDELNAVITLSSCFKNAAE